MKDYRAIRHLVILLALVFLAATACGSVKNFAQGYIQFPNLAVRSLFERMEQKLSLPDYIPLDSKLPGPLSGSQVSEGPPQSSEAGCPNVPVWWPVGVACAQESPPPLPSTTSLPPDPEMALLEELKGMVEVREALLSRHERAPLILDWLRKEIIGEASAGLLVFIVDRKEVDREVLARVANENDDRRIIMRGMVKAVISVNRVQIDERNIAAYIPATQKEFSAVRRRLSPKGTWVQLPDGQWVNK